LSIRVTDPSGTEWTVSREWFGVPRWARRKPSLEFPTDIPASGFADDTSGLAAIALVVLACVVLVVFLSVVLPLVVLLIGIAVAAIALLARLASVSRWTVRAGSAREALTWRVRGMVRSRRLMRDVATALETGRELPEEGAVRGGSSAPG
jgi:hypothetical protein